MKIEQADAILENTSINDVLYGIEMALILKSLRQNHFRIMVAAKSLRMNRCTLIKRLKEFDIYSYVKHEQEVLKKGVDGVRFHQNGRITYLNKRKTI